MAGRCPSASDSFDRLAALLLVVSSIVTLSVYLYAVGQDSSDAEVSGDTPVSIFNPAYLILCAGVSNAFLAGDLFNLYVGFEMLLSASYVLLTLGATTERIRAGVTYIVISLVSSLIFLASIALIYAATGTVNMAHLSERLSELPADIQLILHVALLIGFGIKAAVFPLSFWLPDSYPTAPAPVTAVFAGLLTKVGIYAIIRTETVLFATSDLRVPLLVVSGLTLLVGILGAIAQSDIKRILSFTLVSHIGYMLFGVAMGTHLGLAAAIYYTMHHIVAPDAMFLAIGLLELRAGSTSLRRLRTRTCAVHQRPLPHPGPQPGRHPALLGFIGKVALFTAGFHTSDWLGGDTVGIGTLTSLLTLYAIGKSWNLAFWRDAATRTSPPRARRGGEGASPGARAEGPLDLAEPFADPHGGRHDRHGRRLVPPHLSVQPLWRSRPGPRTVSSVRPRTHRPCWTARARTVWATAATLRPEEDE